MTHQPLDFVVLGLSITSSWGNGHATTYRALLRELAARGHRITFLERDVEWYAPHRDLPSPSYAHVILYDDLEELRTRHADVVRDADVVIVGSYVPEGIDVGDWALRTARGTVVFYDIDTPVTLEMLQHGDAEYIARRQIPEYAMYLSFTGGPTLEVLESQLGSPAARALYCAVDPDAYYPEAQDHTWELAYMGTYSDDRQPVLDRLLVQPARRMRQKRFAVVGPQYPARLEWPANVERIDHLPPDRHRAFYNAQRFTLNVTRAAMVKSGFAPSVRLFEAAACGTPIISDEWPGLDTILTPGREIIVAHGPADVEAVLTDMTEEERCGIAERARARILAHHTAAVRALELEQHVAGMAPVETTI
jgi:spore maturation protein CgeB